MQGERGGVRLCEGAKRGETNAAEGQKPPKCRLAGKNRAIWPAVLPARARKPENIPKNPRYKSPENQGMDPLQANEKMVEFIQRRRDAGFACRAYPNNP